MAASFKEVVIAKQLAVLAPPPDVYKPITYHVGSTILRATPGDGTLEHDQNI